MNLLDDLQKKKKKLKKKKEDWEEDGGSDHPVHERYTKEEPFKEG